LIKTLALVSLFLLTLSCEERIGKYNDLTPDEQNYIRERSRLQCVDSYFSIYDRFKKRSATEVFGSANYDRERGFYNEYKGPSSTRKVDIAIWKQTATEIYFYITEELEGKSSYFLRVTQAQNEAFIDQLLDDHCRKVYKSSTGSDGPLSVVYEFDKINSNNRDYYTDTYTLEFNKLAFFGRFKKSRSVDTRTISDNTRVGEVQSYTSTLVAKNFDFAGNDDATNAAQYTQSFCEQAFEVESKYRFTLDTTGSVQSLKLNCTATPPADWDLTIN
jgi:hypothetical protein